MKRLILIIISTLVLSVSLQAQDVHLKFKGIPIQGDYKAFAQKLMQKEFKEIEATPDGIVLIGNFMATPGTMVVIYPDPTSKKVSMVAAMIKAGDNWKLIESNYHNIINTYKEKYGEPNEEKEEFSKETSDIDSWKLSALHDNACDFHAIWDVEGGRIAITLAYANFEEYIICSYIDSQNAQALRQTIIDDI